MRIGDYLFINYGRVIPHSEHICVSSKLRISAREDCGKLDFLNTPSTERND